MQRRRAKAKETGQTRRTGGTEETGGSQSASAEVHTRRTEAHHPRRPSRNPLPPPPSPPKLTNGITYENSLIPSRSSGSSRQLYVVIWSGETPWTSRIWTTAREKPHCGEAGVPFMKTTSGDPWTA